MNENDIIGEITENGENPNSVELMEEESSASRSSMFLFVDS